MAEAHSWTQDVARCQAAGIPETVHFATKPALAARIIGRALDAGVLVSCMAGDEVYGNSPHLRAALEHRQLGYVLAVACDGPAHEAALALAREVHLPQLRNTPDSLVVDDLRGHDQARSVGCQDQFGRARVCGEEVVE
ncbi:transposase [Streptomyces sp. NPDC057499]|uniref:transposase n=1 Tax=Streptomyces sp. NPDC057499 TaxID=3346150 RepID=UPI00369ECC50